MDAAGVRSAVTKRGPRNLVSTATSRRRGAAQRAGRRGCASGSAPPTERISAFLGSTVARLRDEGESAMQLRSGLRTAMPHDADTESTALPHEIAPESVGLPHEHAPQPPKLPKRDELLETLGPRYRSSTKAEKSRILDEAVAGTGYHRKHAVRLLRDGIAGPRRPFFDARAREALVVAWEASGRVGSRRLKALLPQLVPALEKQGQLPRDPVVRGSLLAVSAATIDRVLAPLRAKTAASLLEERLQNISEALTALADFTIPADLTRDEQRHLRALSMSVSEAMGAVSRRDPG